MTDIEMFKKYEYKLMMSGSYVIFQREPHKKIAPDVVVDLLNENEQLKDLLKEAEDEIENLKKSNKGLMESIVENDFNKAQFVEFLLRIRESGLCGGCKNKDKPVEWYMERGISIIGGSCNRYEPE